MMGVRNNRIHHLPIIVVLAAAVLIIPATNAHAQQPHIGIMLSEVCIRMQSENIENNCPTYEQLLQLDSSVPAISGTFQYDDNGSLYREKPKLKMSYNHFAYSDYPRIFIDPPHNTIPTITIHHDLGTYILRDDLIRTENNTSEYRVLYHDRYIEKCYDASINAEKWRQILADTIYYMRNGCGQQYTLFDEMELVKLNSTEHDITTSQKYQHDQWIKHVKENCIYEYGKC